MLSTPDLCDAHPDRVQCLLADWRHFGAVNQFAGPVSTILCWEDNSRVAEAVQEPGEGRVLLVDGGGSLQRALLGDRLAGLALDNGWAGIVVYGAVRDVEIFAQMPIGIVALRACPMKTDKQNRGERDVELTFEGVHVRPGMWLSADLNGVIVSTQQFKD
jgi:regulator of ribonuclease activity A